MASLVGALRVVLGLNSAQYESGMRRAGRTARTTGRDISQSLAAAQRTAVNAFRGIAAAAGAATLGAAVGSMARYIDAAKQLEAQLRLATRESGTFAQAQEDVRRIASASRSDIEAVSQLYGTFQRNARELGISQAEAARMTETITKAFQISGASAAEAAGGLRQFLQGIQSGTLRGEELNSVLENAPRLARALADGLGVSIGELRRMGQEGELTGQKVKDALLDASEAIDREFAVLPTTFDQAMTQIRNAAIVAFGAFDSGGQFSDALINFAGTGQMSFEQIEASAFETGREIRAIMTGLANIFDPMGEGAVNVFQFIEQEARGLRNALADIIGSIGSAWDTAAAGLAAGMGAHADAAQILASRPGGQLGDRFRAGAGNPFFGPVIDASRRAARGVADRTPGSGGRAISPAAAASSAGGQTRRGGAGSAEAAARRAQREADDAVRRRHDVESELSQARIRELQAQMDLTEGVEQRALLQDQISFIEQGQAEAERRLSVLLRERTQAEADAVADIDTRRFHLERDAIEREAQRDLLDQRLELEEDMFRYQSDELQQQAGLAETAAERRQTELQLLELTHRHEAAKLDAILAEEEAGSHAWNRARAERDALNGRVASARSGVIAGTRGPLESFLASLPTTAAKANEALQSVMVDGLQSLEDGLVGLLEGTKSVADAFSDMAKSIIADLARIAIQRMIVAPLANALFGGSGGTAGGAGLGLVKSMIPGFAHGGSFVVGGNTGVDKNILSINGSPVARVSHGEGVSVGGGGAITINQTFAPSFVGNAPTREEMSFLARSVKAETLEAVRQINRRRS